MASESCTSATGFCATLQFGYLMSSNLFYVALCCSDALFAGGERSHAERQGQGKGARPRAEDGGQVSLCCLRKPLSGDCSGPGCAILDASFSPFLFSGAHLQAKGIVGSSEISTRPTLTAQSPIVRKEASEAMISSVHSHLRVLAIHINLLCSDLVRSSCFTSKPCTDTRYVRDYLHFFNVDRTCKFRRPLHPAVFEELKRQHDRFSYTGPLTGHDGGVSALAFNRET